jgi:hypothetical protein
MLDESIIAEYKFLQNKDKLKTIRFFILYLTAPFIAVALPFLVLYNRGVWAVSLFWSFFGTGLLMLLILGFILINYAGKKPMYDYLYPMIIDSINSETKTNILYESGMDKKNIEFSEYEIKGGLFIKLAEHFTRFLLTYDKQGVQIKAASLRVFSRGDKGREYTHFDGTYFIFNTRNNSYFQLREKQIGKPRHRHVKMTKIDTRDDIKEYIVDEGIGNNFIDRRFYDLYDFLDQKGGRVYISGVPGEVHIALDSSTIKFVKEIGVRSISIDKLLEAQQRVLEILDLSENIVEIIK